MIILVYFRKKTKLVHIFLDKKMSFEINSFVQIPRGKNWQVAKISEIFDQNKIAVYWFFNGKMKGYFDQLIS